MEENVKRLLELLQDAYDSKDWKKIENIINSIKNKN